MEVENNATPKTQRTGFVGNRAQIVDAQMESKRAQLCFHMGLKQRKSINHPGMDTKAIGSLAVLTN